RSSPSPTTTALYTLSLHDALPIYRWPAIGAVDRCTGRFVVPRIRLQGYVVPLRRIRLERSGEGSGRVDPDSVLTSARRGSWRPRSEEHTSELQSRGHLVCRLLLEK